MKFILLVLMLLATPCLATNYWVDQSTGSDSDTGLTEELAWLTLKKATNTAAAGDTVFVKAGTYIDAAASSTHPYPAFDTNNGSAGNYIVFKSDPALAATVRAYQYNASTSSGYMAWGIDTQSYVEINGFKIEGGFRSYYGDHITVKNCEVITGFHPPSDPSLLWGIAFEHTDSGLIQNNYVHDLLPSGNSTHNTACVMIYGTADNNVIEYNSVDGTDSSSTAKAIYNAYGVKAGGTDDNEWANNFGINVVTGFFGIGNTAETVGMYRADIHNNVIVDATMFIELDNNTFNFDVYNNTHYNGTRFVRAIDDNNSGLSLWNNLSGSITTELIRYNTYDQSSNVPSDLLTYSDFNACDATYWYTREASTVNYTLAQFISNTAFGDNSDDSYSPGFASAGADSAQAYKRSSYPTDGRGGAYESVLGAYVDGTETIGYTTSGAPSSPSSTLTAPSNLEASTQHQGG